MNTQPNEAEGVFSFQVSHADLGPLFVDLLQIDWDSRSPLAPVLSAYAAGGRRRAGNDVTSIAKHDSVAKAAAILARPGLIMSNRSGGGSLPVSFFTACYAPLTDEAAFAVVTPSFEGAYLIQLFDSQWLFLAWWLSLNSSRASEPTPNYIPPPVSYESLVYLFHAIDLFRRTAEESRLNYQPAESPSVALEDFGATLKASVRSGDLRWLLPSFLGLTPGLDQFGFEETQSHLEPLARLDFLLPVKSSGDDYERLVFGEAGKAMGVEFYHTWFQAIGFETAVRVNGAWQIANRGFVAPTGLANHLVLIEDHREHDGGPTVNHQAMTGDMLDGKMARLVDEAVTLAAQTPAQAHVAAEGVSHQPDRFFEAPSVRSTEAPRRCHRPECGSVIQPAKVFCSRCGACANCGSLGQAGKKYCSRCGAELRRSGSERRG